MKQAIFRVIHNKKVFGYEKFEKGLWKWMVPELNPDKGERWTNGVMDTEGERNQFIGRLDKKKTKIFEDDIVKYAVKRMICPVCSKKEIAEELDLGISRFCPNCGTKTTDEDFITVAKVVFDKGGFAYLNENDDDTYQSWPIHSAEIYIAWVEVIGNLHETPSLFIKKKR